MEKSQIFEQIKWNNDGLIAVVAQDFVSKRVLMLAWMNQESLTLSIKTGNAVYWSRSRNKLWRKGEESGNTQNIKGFYLDCDGDALVLEVEQIGGVACHTGRESCFYFKLEDEVWQLNEPVLCDPKELYRK